MQRDGPGEDRGGGDRTGDVAELAGASSAIAPWRQDVLRRHHTSADEPMLRIVKVVHTFVWAVFAGSIVAIPVAASLGKMAIAWLLIGFVCLEVLVLLANHMRCPLTDVAGRYTTDRQDNFDIYLPLWLARYNKVIFGGLYVAGVVYTMWMSARR